jgi:parallel beta-helix repeat protein
MAAMALVVVAPASPGWAAGPADEVHYTFTGSTSVAIDWRGTANDVRWGTSTSYGQTATGVAPGWTPWSSPGPFWQLELGGLVPGTTYHYSIGGGPDFTFHAPPTSSFRFDAIGDVGDTVNFSKLGATLDNISADDPSFVLMVGDLTYANGTTIAAVDQHFNDVMGWSTRAAYMPAWGNHEYDVAGSDDLRNYKGRLLMPHAAASPGSPAISSGGNDWGWFDAGPVRFIAYPEPWTGAWSDWQSKAGPLMRQAQDDPNIKYIVTYGHRPAYSTGYHPGESQIASILDGFGQSYSKYVLNINGHSHDYERFQPIQGVTHVTVGAPSSLETPWTSTDPRTAFRAFHLSHMRVDVGPTGLKLQAICDSSASKEEMTCSAGSVIDEYVIGTPPVLPVATSFYVDKTSPVCSDSGSGTSSAPFCTVTKGVSRLQAGNVLYIGDGTYAESIKPSASGTASAPITITSWPGRNPVIGTGVTNGAYISARSYITLTNLTFTGTIGDGIYVTKSDHITVRGNTVTNAGRQAQGATAPGISIRATNSSLVADNNTNHNSDTGIYVTNTSTGDTVTNNESSFNAQGWQRNANGINVTSPGNVVTGNVTHDNEDSGIQLYTGGNNNLVTLNVTYNNGDHGIDNLNVTGGTIVGNTVFRNCTSGINLEGVTSGSYRIANNVAVDNAVYPAYAGIACARRAGNIGVWDGAQNSTLVDHNLVYLSKTGVMYAWGTTYTSLTAMRTASGQEAAGVQADPKFANTGTWDLSLREGSPAIDRGDSGVPGEQATDILGYPRVRDPNVANTFASGPRLYDDLGAYEYQPDLPPPAVQPPVAGLTLTPTSGTAPLAVSADASTSTDPQGQTLRYSFDFGDGTTLSDQPSAVASHSYPSAGTYTVTVTARNTSGLTGTASGSVVVAAPPPPVQPPSASLVMTPANGTAPLSVTADASTSTDPQGQALTYAFDFGDGTTLPAQSAPTATHVYTSVGTFTAKVTVRNASGLSTPTTATVVTTAPAVQPPAASLTVTPASGAAPLALRADASASSDPQGQALSYAFDFGDGTTVPSSATVTADHTYTAAGSYTVTVTVTNASGLSDTTARTVSVTTPPPPVQPPVASLGVTLTSGTAPLNVSADASASSDPQGQALSYAFDFGDGATVPASTTATAAHTYTAAGSYSLTVTVTNTSGLTATDQKSVTISAPPPPDQPPTASLAVTPSSGTAPLQVSADASASRDPQGQTLSYAFDFGDGATVSASATATASHAYATAGSYTVTVTVANTSGLTATDQRTVSVSAPPPPIQAPAASLTVSPSSGTAPVAVTADASTSTDPQGQSLSYAFDFGDGTTVPASTTATATHTYTTAGSYTVAVTVTNTSSLSATATKPVTVTAPIQPPTASLTVTPSSGTAPVTVTADGSASTDPQGQALTYGFAWGDGTTTAASANATATHAYTTAGTRTVTLTVTNTSGKTASATRAVTVTAAQAPTASLTVTPSSGTAPVTVAADASASTDPQGQALTYGFAWGDGTTTAASATPTATHAYPTAGSYTVTVTVTNTSGLTSTAPRAVTVSAPLPGYVGTVGTASSTTTGSSGVITLGPTTTVQQNHLVVVTLEMLAKSANGAVAATDTAGNTYTVAHSVTVSGGRLVVLTGLTAKPLPAGAKITVTFPGATTYRMVADDLLGVTKVDQVASATGTSQSFSSGSTLPTKAAREVVFGAVSTFTSSSNPTWTSAWTALTPQAAASTNLGRAYQLPTAVGTFQANGTTSGTWAALVLTFQP